MITQIDKQTQDFLVKKKLTFNQFCMCLMIHNNDVSGIIRYTEEIGFLTGGTVVKPNGAEIKEFDDLIARGYIVYLGNSDRQNQNALDYYKVSEKFTKGFLDNFGDNARELWTTYPKEGKQGESTFTAKSVDYDEFADKYIEIQKQDASIHEINMTRLRTYLKGNKYAQMGIMKYIGSRHWENLTDDARKIRLH